MDGSQKLPQRMIGTLNDLAELKIPAPKMLNALATWIKYLQISDSISDPLASELKSLALAEKYSEIFTLLTTPLNPIYSELLSNNPITFADEK